MKKFYAFFILMAALLAASAQTVDFEIVGFVDSDGNTISSLVVSRIRIGGVACNPHFITKVALCQAMLAHRGSSPNRLQKIHSDIFTGNDRMQLRTHQYHGCDV